jgi:hypothetical protein
MISSISELNRVSRVRVSATLDPVEKEHNALALIFLRTKAEQRNRLIAKPVNFALSWAGKLWQLQNDHSVPKLDGRGRPGVVNFGPHLTLYAKRDPNPGADRGL